MRAHTAHAHRCCRHRRRRRRRHRYNSFQINSFRISIFQTKPFVVMVTSCAHAYVTRSHSDYVCAMYCHTLSHKHRPKKRREEEEKKFDESKRRRRKKIVIFVHVVYFVFVFERHVDEQNLAPTLIAHSHRTFSSVRWCCCFSHFRSAFFHYFHFAIVEWERE